MSVFCKKRNFLAHLILLAAAAAAVPQASAQVAIQPTALPYGGVNQAYATTFLLATGGGSPYAWVLDSGALPPGMTLTSTGGVSGTPTQAGSFSFTAKVTAADSSTASASMSVLIVDISTSATLPGAQAGIAYTQTLAGTAPNPTWIVNSGSIPGLTLSTSGILSGTPTTYGNYNLTVRAIFPNVPGLSGAPNVTADKTFSITVSPDLPAIQTSSLNDATTGSAFTQAIQGIGGVPPYTITGTLGTLPPGLSVTGNQLTGTPLVADIYNIQFRVEDSVGGVGFRTLQMTIRDPLSISTSTLPPGVTGTSYTQGVQAAGGKPPYTMIVLSGMPPGLSLVPNGNQFAFSGSPTQAQVSPYAVQFQVTDSLSTVVTKTLSLTIVNPLTITTTTLPFGVTGTAYNPTVSAAGGQPPYTISANQATLPPGLNFNGTSLTGSPTTVGVYSAQFNVSDNLGFTASQTISITIVNPLAISTSSLAPGITGSAYSQTVAASGGQTPHTITAVGGTLPPGLSFNGSQLTGTPTTVGLYNVQFNVTDNLSATATRTIPITIVDPLVVQTSSLGNATTGVAYSQLVQAAGGQPPYSISLATTPPPGLTFNGTALSGTPTLAGIYPLQFNVTDNLNLTGTRTLTVTVRDPLSISTTSLGAGSVGVAYSQPVQAAGGFPGYTITANPASLPPGLSFNGTLLTGTPTQAGAYSAEFSVIDTQTNTASRTIGITITGGLAILTSSLPEGRTTVAYSQTVQAAGGLAPYTITAAPNTLPPGLTFNGSILSGTPTTVGVYGIQFQVTDANTTVASRTLTVTVRDPLMISTTSLAPSVLNVAYSQAVQASGGLAPYTVTATPNTLPPGITFNGSVLSGTPTTPGNYQVQFHVTDALSDSASRTLSLVVNGSLSIFTTSLPEGRTTVAYSQTIQAGGGVAPYTITATPNTLPPGLTFNGTVLAGTPTQTGDFNIDFHVSDALSNTASRSVPITIRNPLQITTSSLPAATTTVAYSQTIDAAGGLGPYTITATVGSLPPGITFSGTQLTGTPTQTGTYQVQFQVTDSLSGAATRTLALAVRDPLVISTSSLPEGRTTVAYSQTVAPAGGLAPYTISATPASLPPGLTFNGTVLAGTPTQTGVFQAEFQVTDAANVTASRTLAVTIRNPLQISTLTLPVATTTVAYSQTIQASGGLGPYTITVTPGTLPPGFTFDGTQLAGSPTVLGTYPVEFNVTDSLSGSASRVISVAIRNPLVITTSSLAPATARISYSATVQAAGGLAPYTITALPTTLPAGLTFNGTLLSGTPTAGGLYPIQFQVVDAAQVSAIQIIHLTVRDGLYLSVESLPDGTVGRPYSQPIQAAGGVEPYTVTAADSSLPPGLFFDGAHLAGTPREGGGFVIEFQLRDGAGITSTFSAPINIFATTPNLIRVFPLTLRFNAFQGGAAPPEQLVEVTSATGSIEEFTVTLASVAQSQPSWVAVSGQPGTTPAQLHLRVDPANLTAGTYTATLSIRSGVQAPQLVPIVFIIDPPAPALEVAPRIIQLSSRTVNPRAEAEVVLRNVGGGAATTFEARLAGSSSWTRLNQTVGSLSPLNPTFLRLAFDTTGLRPGAYRDELIIRTGIGETRVPVSLFIEEPGAALSASTHGIRLAGRQGDAANARATFQVRNSGSAGTTTNWKATILRGSDVFTITPSQGAATPGAPSTVVIGLKPTATDAAGPKSALLKIEDPAAQGSPEYVVLVADISAADAQPVVELSPGGLVFTGTARSVAPPLQTITVSTGAASLPFTVSTSITGTDITANWLSVNTASGTTSATSPATIRVNVNPGTLSPGIYTGLVTVHAAGQVLSTHVTLILTTPISQFSEAPKPGEATSQLAVGCTPSRAVLSQTALNEGFAIPAGWPAGLAVRLLDDCGTALTGGDVVATFSNGDAPLVLEGDPLSGLFTAAWQPGSVSAAATVRLEAVFGSLTPAWFELRGSVKSNPVAPPSLVKAGLLNNLNPLVGAAIAPGTITQIYGANLSALASVATTTPLPTVYQGVEAIIGGLSAPIYYTSANQLTVQVPSELVPNRQYSVILTNASGFSQPTMLPVVPVQPGTVAINDGTLFATHGNSSRVDSANPGKPNEIVTLYLVGMGATTPSVPSGSVAPSNPPAWVNTSAVVSVDGQPAEVVFQGLCAGRVGLYQLNFRVPANARPGLLDIVISQDGVQANSGKLPVGAQ